MMKKTALTLAALTLFATPAFAAEGPATGFGFVDVPRILQTSDAAKNILAQGEAKYKEFQTKISKEEDGIRALQKEFEKERDTLSKEELAKKYKDLPEKFAKVQRISQESKRIFDSGLAKAMDKLRSETATVVKGIAAEKNLAAVFTQESVIVAVPELDITAAVVERLNKSVKKIPVDWTAADTKK
jgi:outer membrane protein